jgi:endonuclease YncB( thermonuclease family)
MRPAPVIASLALILLATPASAEMIEARVTRVADGDTITVVTADKRTVRIRLQGIDAPERTMPYSQVSRRHLQELVMNKTLKFSPDKLDRHGRIVAVVRLQDGTDVCLAQIQAGLAWHFKHYEAEQSVLASSAAREVFPRGPPARQRAFRMALAQ